MMNDPETMALAKAELIDGENHDPLCGMEGVPCPICRALDKALDAAHDDMATDPSCEAAYREIY